MASPADLGNRSLGMRSLPRPQAAMILLRALAVLLILGGAAGVVAIWTVEWPGLTTVSLKVLASIGLAVPAVLLWPSLLYAASLLVEYSYHMSLNIRMAERRLIEKEAEAATARPAGETSAEVTNQIVTLLREINENTLLAESDKARKRARLADSRREAKIAEIQQFIAATKWPAARERIADFQAEYGDDPAAGDLRRQLDNAVKEHEQIDIMSSGEQIRSYMSLGLWEKAREATRQLSRRYPQNPDAQKLEQVLHLEEEAGQREDRLRLYREIEHLVTRKHYRDARKAAERLIERYGSSPEAATLHGQMEELTRNADIETRREMEGQIIEYSRQNRDKEAYEMAKLLMEQYPESPQALALKDQIDKLRERAGATL